MLEEAEVQQIETTAETMEGTTKTATQIMQERVCMTMFNLWESNQQTMTSSQNI